LDFSNVHHPKSNVQSRKFFHHPISLTHTPLLKNMKPILTQLFAGIFLLLASQAFGQGLTTSFVVTTPPSAPQPYPIGSQIVVELRVTNFTNIESMQFPITYNKVALKFDSLRGAVFPNWSNGNFVSVPASGKIGISWDGYSNGANSPFSFPNGTAIFKMYFTAISDGMSNINISPAAAPPSVDVVGGGQPVVLNYQNGGTGPIQVGTGQQPLPPLFGFKIVANTIYIPKGERGCMPVTVNDFDGIQSMQWVLHWDKSVLTYECTRRYNLSGLSGNDLNEVPALVTQSPNQGNLVCAWADPAGEGVTLADGTRIVDICFKAIGAPGANNTIRIDSTGLAPSAGFAEAYNNAMPAVNVWTNATHVNGTSGVNAPIHIIVTNPPSFDVAYKVDTISTAPNTQGCVAVKVKNFTAISSSEFALSYNPTQLTYVNTQFGANPLNLQAANITHVANPGVIKFLWANANGASVANDATIFSACFTVIAAPGTTADVSFTSTACPTVTGIGTAKSTGGVSMSRENGWIKAVISGPTLTVLSHVNCFGGNTGSINLQNPPSTVATAYAWSNGMTMEDPTGLAAGTYTVTVTYSGGTTGTNTAIITQPAAALTATHTVNTVSCFNGSNGAINLTPSGGTAPYSYLWSNGSTAEDPSGLAVSVYTPTITDAKGCTLVVPNIPVTGFTSISVASPAITNVSCAGLSTGAIFISPTGGSGGYIYLWSNGMTTQNLSNVAANTYTVRVTDSNGCSRDFPASGAYTILGPQPLVSTFVSKTDVKCSGTPTGTASITVTGGTGNYNYCWNNGSVTCTSMVQNPTNLPAGTYTAIVTDQNGCTSTVANVLISNPPSPLSVTGTTTNSPCFDQPSGAINAAGAGGWAANYQYAWSGPISPIPPVPNPSPLPGGLYTVTVTDASQCTSTSTFTISGSPAILANTVVQPVSCFGVNNGGINLNLTGGNPPYSVSWSGTTLTGPSIGVLEPGTYQPTVTDAQNCTKVFAPIVITGPAGPINTANAVVTETNQNGGSINLNPAGGTGNPDFWDYSWVGPNGFTAFTQDITGPSVIAGTYTVTVFDANNCTLSFTFVVPEGNVVAQAQIFSVVNACSDDGCILLTIPPAAAVQTPLTINWGSGSTQTNSLSPSICGLTSGLYVVTVTAANGNSIVLSTLSDGFTPIEIDQLAPASVDALSQNPFDEQADGKIVLTPISGSGPLTYQWGSPLTSTSNQVTGLDSGLYVVTITNVNSQCTSERYFHLDRQYPNLVVSTDVVTNPNCSAVASGAIDLKVVGGNDPYEYNWTGPNGFVAITQDINTLMPGFYSVTVTDFNDTIRIRTFTLTSQSNLAITNVNETSLFPSGHQVSGANMCDGQASVVFIAGLGTTSIVWSNGVTGPGNATLCGGAYSVTVTDAAGCSSVWSDALTFPPAITSQSESVDVNCHEDCDGSAKITVQGGFAPYSVQWSTGQNDPAVFPNGFSQAVNLCGGDYTVTITDKNGVSTVTSVNVVQPPEIVVSFATTTPRSFNACDGELFINAAGATAPVTYVWSGSFGHAGNGERADNLCAGEFVEFYVTDANGCTAYATDSVPYPEDGCFRVSPVLTPGQQDGKNDNVYITCIETTLENHIEIYNRWGQLVFETDDYTNEDSDREHNWNGLTNSGAPLAEGVYYFVLTYTFIDDQGQKHDDVRKGAINLLQ